MIDPFFKINFYFQNTKLKSIVYQSQTCSKQSLIKILINEYLILKGQDWSMITSTTKIV